MKSAIANVKIDSDNYYYKFGLYQMLAHIYQFEKPTPGIKKVQGQVSILFRQNIASIIYPGPELTLNTLDIPFVCNTLNLSEINAKLEKIMMVTQYPYFECDKQVMYQRLGIKSYHQLSGTEFTVLRYCGKGFRPREIALILDCSEKTVNTHCRNAMRKMGMSKRVELYQYATLVMCDEGRERATLCL
ncbi:MULTISPECIES: helix-turn-helix transcriptional regulator [Lelliottia]|uniref:LuxR C-terminal-related transcriptional regulator n=1 Tax=Lelliottia wanjuensis TaxID=3050585 RepID=A0AAP4FRF3_9ENTR|nr:MULTISPECIES: LuxR C-terminal-related transcriptional regulator [unclassified Lelliottia]MDK9361836.1 LuxR C-terminal-related transcriptional regulator [Lelliottia sp. V106_12]MDK9582988.1 LuxR C-terminal-related transcriptional regulator [Lelliottia sp. V86_10]MDK9618553.1 LuxR C-terminal-related transcriptional regulator [Lelliottia sp. V106_9]